MSTQGDIAESGSNTLSDLVAISAVYTQKGLQSSSDGQFNEA